MLRKALVLLAGLFGGLRPNEIGFAAADIRKLTLPNIDAVMRLPMPHTISLSSTGIQFHGRTIGTRKAMREAKPRRRFNARLSKRA